MRYPIVVFAVLAACTMFGGCEYVRVLAFTPEPDSGDARPYTVRTMLAPGPPTTAGPGALTPKRALFSSIYGETLDAECAGARVPTNELLAAPILGALIGFAVDQFVGAVGGALSSRAEDLERRSQRSYSGRLLVKPKETPLAGPGRCLVIERIAQTKAGEAGATALIISLTPFGDEGDAALLLKPVFVQLDSALAVTKRGRGVGLSVALAARVARNAASGPRVDEIGFGAFSIGALKVGEARSVFVSGAGSGLTTLVHPEADAVEISVGLVETGSDVPDADKATAEIKALQAAVGPKLRELLLSKL